MSDSQQLIDKITALESDLLDIYREIYSVLIDAERINLPDQIVDDLDNLEPPEAIEVSKAIAVIKSILNATPQDYFQFEWRYNVQMETEIKLGIFLRERLQRLDTRYEELEPYLYLKGWMKKSWV
jgi:hypothetical protein